MRTIRIGAGAGYSGDRIEPAVELAERGALHYLVFECLAERTIALSQQARALDAAAGFDPLLLERMRAVLPACAARGIRIITNMGAANPTAAAAAVADLARRLGLHGLRIAAVSGDDVLADVAADPALLSSASEPAERLVPGLVSANAYLGVEPLLEALGAGADVVIAGRVADPSLFLAPQIHEFDWSLHDPRRMGQGTVVGHLLECAGQVTGGYFADPGYKDVVGLARLGFPLAEVQEDGTAVITKVPDSGGRVTVATCKEQLLYEIQDPAAYFTPDVVANFTGVRFRVLEPDRIVVTGGSGAPRPDTLKVSLGYLDGFIGEGQISYAGPGAIERARLAIEIVRDRFALTHLACDEVQYDLIGVNALHGPELSSGASDPYEVRVRVAGRTRMREDAARIGREVEALYTNGPAGGGGAVTATREVLAIASMSLARERVVCRVDVETV